MSIGNFEYYFIPVLKVLNEKGKMHRRAVMDCIAVDEKLTKDELELATAKGTNIFRSRVHWAQSFLAQAGAIKRPQRGYLEITERGRELLLTNPNGFKSKIFHEFDDYKNAWSGRGKDTFTNNNLSDFPENETPLEKIELAIEQLENSVAGEVIEKLQAMSPKFLEHVVLNLLHAMGYGDSHLDMEHLGGPGDEGVDGVINQDALGLQRIYVQAKRYKSENSIGRPEIQKFVGALTGLGANGGIFITTSSFTADAASYAKKNQLSPRIILIDGLELGRLMVRHNVGVNSKKIYRISDIDEDFFEEI